MKEDHGVSTLVVAGVGSSALGTAALARDVADVIGAPVAGVVSGYGLADLPFEASGGYFFFGGLSRARHIFRSVEQMFRAAGKTNGAANASADFTDIGVRHPSLGVESIVQGSPDTHTVRKLFEQGDFRLAVGHSKGNYVIAEALSDLASNRLDNVASTLQVVNLSARSELPNGFHAVNVMGAIDNFGMMNSVPSWEPFDYMPVAWHHTNKSHPSPQVAQLALDVGEALITLSKHGLIKI